MSDSKTQVNSYSPEGRIYQIEYAMKASSLGTTTIGLVAGDCVILMSEKKAVNALQILSSVKKHHRIFDNMIFGFSGIAGDARSIAERARAECVAHLNAYDENPIPESLLKKLCSLALQFGEEDNDKKIFSRPFGVSILVAAYDNEPKLYLFDASGSYKRFRAKALGSAAQSVEIDLCEQIKEFKGRNETILRGLRMLKKVMRDSLNENNIEIDIVDKNGLICMEVEQIKEMLLNL